MRASFLFLFVILFSFSNYGQDIDSLYHSSPSEPKELEYWHTAPSVKWNATAALNFWTPAASVGLEFPFNKYLGIEVEGGPILPHIFTDFVEERFNGIRARIGPKFYFPTEINDVFYLKLLAKYDRANSLQFKTILDPSQSFQQDLLVEGKFENRGIVLYAGYILFFGNNRFTMDVSGGVGYSKWNEEIFLPEGARILDLNGRLFNFGQRTGPTGEVPVLSINLQFGYRFNVYQK